MQRRTWQNAADLCSRLSMTSTSDCCYLCSSCLDDALQWRYNERDGVSNHRRLDCWLNRLFKRRSNKTSQLHVTCLCDGNLPVTSIFPVPRPSNAEEVSIWWRVMIVLLHDDAANILVSIMNSWQKRMWRKTCWFEFCSHYSMFNSLRTGRMVT